MDVSAIATLLAPCLGALLAGVEHATEDVARSVGEHTWEYAQRLWRKIAPRLSGRAAAEEAVQDVAAAPEDPRARGALELQLEKLLAADPELAAAVEQVMGEARAAGVVAGGERSVAVGGNVSGTIITGDRSRAGS